MKKTWYKLTPKEATHIYCIPDEIANDPAHHFWGLTYQHDQELFEGNWPLIALLHNKPYSTALTLQVHTLHMEHIHVSDIEGISEAYNPLTTQMGGGRLSLSLEQFVGLCNILRAQEDLLADDEAVSAPQSVFRLLQDDETQLYRLHPEWFPDVQKSYYYQRIQPPIAVEKKLTTLIAVSTSSTLSHKMSFQILTFDMTALADELFTPLRRSGPQLYLNRSGLLELIEILSQAAKQAA